MHDIGLNLFAGTESETFQPADVCPFIKGLVARIAQRDKVLLHTHAALRPAHYVAAGRSRRAAQNAGGRAVHTVPQRHSGLDAGRYGRGFRLFMYGPIPPSAG